MYKYFVYVNKYDKRVRVHTFDCKKCKNLKLDLQEQQVSKNGIWYGFFELGSAKEFAIMQRYENTEMDRCI
jgi:exo-beta-1,3-glucanase (GH17 family)